MRRTTSFRPARPRNVPSASSPPPLELELPPLPFALPLMSVEVLPLAVPLVPLPLEALPLAPVWSLALEPVVELELLED